MNLLMSHLQMVREKHEILKCPSHWLRKQDKQFKLPCGLRLSHGLDERDGSILLTRKDDEESVYHT